MYEHKADLITFERKGNTATRSLPVGAKKCLWFAWAPTTEPGVEGETLADDTYRPVVIDVTGVHEVQLTVDPADQWEHHPGYPSNAGGLGQVRGLENPGYRHARLRSDKIDPLDARLNSLVAMQGFDTPPTSAKPIELIGLQATLTIGNGHDRLFLGFHDGHDWTNNSGSVYVTVTVTYQNDIE